MVVLLSQGIGCCAVIVLVAARGAGPPDLVRMLPAAAAGVAGVAALTAFYRALAIGTMSVVAPIAATGVAVPVIVGVAGGDRPASVQLAGILVAVVGVVLASRERPAGVQSCGNARASVGLALIAALGFGSYLVGIRVSARADVLWALLASRGAGVGALLAATVVWGTSGGADLARARFWPLAAIGALDLAANGLYALATRHALLSVVAVAASLYPLATMLLARALLGERVRRVQALGVAAALAGVVLIAAG